MKGLIWVSLAFVLLAQQSMLTHSAKTNTVLNCEGEFCIVIKCRLKQQASLVLQLEISVARQGL